MKNGFIQIGNIAQIEFPTHKINIKITIHNTILKTTDIQILNIYINLNLSKLLHQKITQLLHIRDHINRKSHHLMLIKNRLGINRIISNIINLRIITIHPFGGKLIYSTGISSKTGDQ